MGVGPAWVGRNIRKEQTVAYLIEIKDPSGRWIRWAGSYRYASQRAAQAGVDRFNAGLAQAMDPQALEMLGSALTDYRIRAVGGRADSNEQMPWTH